MTMRETTDRFEIARRDLESRGPGEFLGARTVGPGDAALCRPRDRPMLVEQARNVTHSLLHEAYGDRAGTVDARLARWLGGREEFLKV